MTIAAQCEERFEMAPKLDQGAEHVVADKESPTRRTAHHSEAKL